MSNESTFGSFTYGEATVSEKLEQISGHSSRLVELSKTVGSFLLRYDYLAIPTLVNSHSIRLKLPKSTPTNSNILVFPKGSGKSVFLSDIISKHNDGMVINRSDIHHEYMLMNRADEEFDHKIWICDDLVVTLAGLEAGRQRNQLTGFYTAILSKGEYERDGVQNQFSGMRKIEDAVICCQYGLASEYFRTERKQLFNNTLLDRMIPIYAHLSDDDARAIIRATIKRSSSIDIVDPPNLKLTELDGEPIHIKIDSSIDGLIEDAAITLYHATGLAPGRAASYINNFVSSNALLNDRKIADIDDMEVWEFIQDMHLPYSEGSARASVLHLLASSTTHIDNSGGVMPLTTKDLATRLGEHYQTIAAVMFELREEGTVHWDRIDRGEYIYWLGSASGKNESKYQR